MTDYYVNFASVGGDGTTPNLTGATAAFKGLGPALTELFNISPSLAVHGPLNINCTGTTDDTSTVTWPAFTNASATNRITILGDPPTYGVGGWDTSRYRRTTYNVLIALEVATAYTRLINLQVQGVRTNNANSTCVGIRFNANFCQAFNTIGRVYYDYTGAPVGSNANCYGVRWGVAFTDGLLVNCIGIANGDGVPWTAVGLYASTSVVRMYNCAGYAKNSLNAHDGIWQADNSKIFAKNCIGLAGAGGEGFGSGYTWNVGGCINNVSEDATAPGTGSRTNQTVSEIDRANGNMILLPHDTAARGYGSDRSDDAFYAFDYDFSYGPRRGKWDIGPHQIPYHQLALSVAQDKATP